jgi:hypothetical protein
MQAEIAPVIVPGLGQGHIGAHTDAARCFPGLERVAVAGDD